MSTNPHWFLIVARASAPLVGLPIVHLDLSVGELGIIFPTVLLP